MKLLQASLLLLATAVSCNSPQPGTNSGDDQGGAGSGGSAGGRTAGSGGGGTGGASSGGKSGGTTGSAGQGGDSAGSGGAAAGAGGMGGAVAGGMGGGGTTAGAGGGASGNAGAAMACAQPMMVGIVRDFNDTHPDFQPGGAAEVGAITKSLVKPSLGADDKPEYAWEGPSVDSRGLAQIQSKMTFDQWFRTTAGVNQAAVVTLPFKQVREGVQEFGGYGFRPINGKLMGNKDGVAHTYPADADSLAVNDLFTIELIAEFEYQDKDGEVILFATDDDGWVFVNGKLAIDMGGIGVHQAPFVFKEHAAEFGLVKGNRYRIHFFMADRHFNAADMVVRGFGVKFTNCMPIMPKD